MMKPRNSFCQSILAALAAGNLIWAATASAATYYWDTNGTSANFGAAATGNWGTSAFWSTSSAGAVTTTNPPTTTSDDVNFGTVTAGFTTNSTVTISGTANAKSITFGAGNAATERLVLSGGTGLNLAAIATITSSKTTPTGYLELATALAGAGTSLTINSTTTGSFIRGSVNGTRSVGNTIIDMGGDGIATTSGAFQYFAANPFGTTGTTLQLNSGRLNMSVGASIAAGYNTTVTGDSAIYLNTAASSSATFGTLSIGTQTLTTGVYNASAVAGAITFGATTLTGNPTFNVSNDPATSSSGVMTLALGALQNDGDFTVQSGAGTGVLRLSQNAAAGRTSGIVTVKSGVLQHFAATPLGGTGVSLQLNGGTVNISSTGVSSIAPGHHTTIGGNSAIQLDTAVTNSATFGDLEVGPYTFTVAAYNSSGPALVNFGTTTLTGNATFNVSDGTGAANLTLGSISDGGASYSLTKTGSGILTLTSTNDYHGGTVISAGTLRLAQRPVAAIPTGLQIMPMGDSITLGLQGTHAGYRGYLYPLLSPAAPGFQFMGPLADSSGPLPSTPIDQRHHCGFSGFSCKYLTHNFDGLDDTLAQTHPPGTVATASGGYWLTGGHSTGRVAIFPNLLLLQIGSNDIPQGLTSEYRTNLTDLLNLFFTLRPTARVIVADITPHKSNGTDDPVVLAANDAALIAILNQVVDDFQARGYPVSRVDLNTGFSLSWISDRVHPNDTGYAWMATRWYNAILDAYTPKGVLNGHPSDSPVSIATGGVWDLNGNAATTPSLTGSGEVMLGNGGSLTISPSAAIAFDGRVSGAGSLTKTGAGMLTLSGANTFNGATSIAGGTLLLTGSVISPINVSTGAVLGGSGSSTKAVTCAGTLAPGTAGTPVGTLSTGDATLTGTYECQLNAGASDQLAVTGNLDLNGATIHLSETAPSTGSSYIIATYTGSLAPIVTPPVITGLTQYTLNTATPGQIKLVKNNYATWASQNGVAGEAASDDHDRDGIENGMEYALGLNPLLPNGAPGTISAAGVLTFTKGSAAILNGDVTYVIEESEDLGKTDPWSAVVTQAPPNSSPTISFQLPPGKPREFVRLKITIQ